MMKQPISLALSLCVVLSAWPAAEQAALSQPAGPIARAIDRHAGNAARSDAGFVQQSRAAYDPWSRVRGVKRGTEIVVTVRGSLPVRRHFVSADGNELAVSGSSQPTVFVTRFARSDVLEIRGVPGHPVRRGALIGAGIGSGIILAMAADHPCTSHSECYWTQLAVTFGGMGAGAGAGVGLMIGESQKRSLIYRAP